MAKSTSSARFGAIASLAACAGALVAAACGESGGTGAGSGSEPNADYSAPPAITSFTASVMKLAPYERARGPAPPRRDHYPLGPGPRSDDDALRAAVCPPRVGRGDRIGEHALRARGEQPGFDEDPGYEHRGEAAAPDPAVRRGSARVR